MPEEPENRDNGEQDARLDAIGDAIADAIAAAVAARIPAVAAPQGLVEEPFLGGVVPNPANVPNVRVLTGFLGKSVAGDDEEHVVWRLYETLDVSTYIEIRERDIIHSVKYELEPPNHELTRTVLWVKAEAIIASVTHQPLGAADFLEGPIASGWHGGAPDCSCGHSYPPPNTCCPGHGGGGGGGGGSTRWPCGGVSTRWPCGGVSTRWPCGGVSTRWPC